MPRTKIKKNAKRNREAENREEKIRIFELKKESVMMSLDEMEVRYKTMVDNQIQLIESRLQTELREMKMPVFLELLQHLDHFSDFKASDHTQHAAKQSMCSNTTSDGNKNSCQAVSAYIPSVIQSAKELRKPGPLLSAHARREPRSRSACDDNKVLVKASATPSCSRSKLTTPLAKHNRSLSADRMPRQKHQSSASTPPMAFLRWPKPGEQALSLFGSPILAQMQPETYANVNIPIRNGVLSLRPKKLDEIKPDLLENLNANTLSEIRTLHENLEIIMKAADKVGMK